MTSFPTGLMTTYGRQDVAFVRGAGAWLWDTDDKRYLDALSGIAVCGLGHAHPEITAALCAQGAKLWHTSNLYRIPAQEALGRRLTALAGLSAAFFCNSGAEANEAAIKIARRYGYSRGVERPAVLVAEGSFHGRTLATLSATGNVKVQQGFEPLVEGFVRVSYGDSPAAATAVRANADIVAILVEPIQGEGGIVLPPAGYLSDLRRLCDERELLLMFDEVQTGMCRTGHWFACQHEAVLPDVMTLAKALGNGFPIGACLAGGAAAEVLVPGSHGSTFGGNPLAATVALAVIEVLARDDLAARAAVLGERLLDGFRRALAGELGVRAVRGRGLMLGIELDWPCADLVARGIDAGVLLNVTANSVVRLLPPLVMSDGEADLVVERVGGLIREFLAGARAA